MTEQIKYYRVTDGYNTCVWQTEQEAKDMVSYEYEWIDSPLLKIEEVLMTEEEFNNLNEFDGF